MNGVNWPKGKRFAFTVFDDPDACSEESRLVYHFLADLGFRTTMAVWPIGPLRERNSGGETCADLSYRAHAQQLQSRGFEIAYHNAAPHSCTREEIRQSFEVFHDHFGTYPAAAANHYNTDALYWGSSRFHEDLYRSVYDLVTLGRQRNRFRGHVEDQPYFWGDLCREYVRYFRNFVYREVNTLKVCPYQPYYDPERPFVSGWFSSAEGTDCASFVETIAEANLDRLQEEGGMCIMYAHFGKGFVQGGKLNSRFSELMTRLSRSNGWFAPVTEVLDHLRSIHGVRTIPTDVLKHMEWKWLRSKLIYGRS